MSSSSHLALRPGLQQQSPGGEIASCGIERYGSGRLTPYSETARIRSRRADSGTVVLGETPLLRFERPIPAAEGHLAVFRPIGQVRQTGVVTNGDHQRGYLCTGDAEALFLGTLGRQRLPASENAEETREAKTHFSVDD